MNPKATLAVLVCVLWFQTVPEAIKVLVSVTGNQRAPDAARVSAAKEILETVPPGRCRKP